VQKGLSRVFQLVVRFSSISEVQFISDKIMGMSSLLHLIKCF